MDPLYEYRKGEGWVLSSGVTPLPSPVKLGHYYSQNGRTYLCTTIGDIPNKPATIMVYTLGAAPHGSGARGAVIGQYPITVGPFYPNPFDDDIWVLVEV